MSTTRLACVRIHDLTVTRAFHLITHSRSALAQPFLSFVESKATPPAS